MKLSAYSDDLFRVLMHAALRSPERVTVAEVAGTFGLPCHHVAKVVRDLSHNGLIATHRGDGGGFTLGRPAERIRLGDIVRLREEGEELLTCTNREERQCRLFPACRLKVVLAEAVAAFFAVLDHYSLADLLKPPSRLRSVLGLCRNRPQNTLD
ncbi:MAG TPA: Rrf2 family transcriptional regulator [Verrucomicrobiota bacterium]|nr:Rrf2 family transcriptional regulator [Verrucomicrobiota bacterium]HRZ36964.1 Rrf2 family transcriptional regulator [Candidatus Paceibacterota bacterium]HRZ57487.1 Rrf2 family transcriptional regulator [Candidatus Paceibacterota bacterium]